MSLPECMEEELGSVYSNFDHELDKEIMAQLMANPKCFARHAAWNFNSLVWFDGKLWHEEVWRYNCPMREYTGEDLKELIDEINDEYGHD